MKKVLISILTVFFITSMITTVYAATGSVELSASSDSVIKGKTFTVTVMATADKNVTGISGLISYEKSKLSLEDITASNGFVHVPSGDELNAGILSTEGITLSKSVIIYTLTFKALDTAEEGETEISLTDIQLGLVTEDEIQEEADAGKASIKINIKADDTTVGGESGNNGSGDNGTGDNGTGDNGTGDNGTGDNGSGNGGASDENKEPSKDKETSKDKKPAKLPQTGIKSTVVIAIVVLGILSIISYILYRKNNDIK